MRLTVCVEPRLPELSERVSRPLALPVTVGAKDTKTVQLDPAIKSAGQVVVSTNPALAVKERSSGLPPKFSMVNCCDGLAVPMF